MIVGIEGLSASGKTTFIDKFIERYPETIRFRGAGAVNIGMQSRWQEYNFWMHNIIEQLDRLNNYKKIILWDRFLTDTVYSEDRLYKNEILRIIKSHARKCVIYIDLPKEELIKRGTKEGDELDIHLNRYESVLKSFNTHIIKPVKDQAYYINNDHIDSTYQFIKKEMGL